jgi:hypothetical protein
VDRRRLSVNWPRLARTSFQLIHIKGASVFGLIMARLGPAAANSPYDAKIRTQTSADQPDVSAEVEQARCGTTRGVAADDLHDRIRRNLCVGTRSLLRRQVQFAEVPAHEIPYRPRRSIGVICRFDCQTTVLVIARSSCDEAIHSSFMRRDGLLRCARNDVDTLSHSRDALRPRFAGISSPSQIQRAQGMPDARCTRGLMRSVHKGCAHEHTGQRRTSDIPCAMALRHITSSPR